MKKIMHPSLTMGSRKPFLNRTEESLTRIDMVLKTRPGQLPWNPEFGCDMTDLIGESATEERISAVQEEVKRSLRQSLPAANVLSCDVHLVTGEGQVVAYRDRSVPTAESALVALGTDARLELRLDIEVENDIVELGTELEI